MAVRTSAVPKRDSLSKCSPSCFTRTAPIEWVSKINLNQLQLSHLPLSLFQFSFESCKFKIQRSKEGTGRIVVWMLGITNAYTIEASFGGSLLGSRKGTHFNTQVIKQKKDPRNRFYLRLREAFIPLQILASVFSFLTSFLCLRTLNCCRVHSCMIVSMLELQRIYLYDFNYLENHYIGYYRY